MRREGYGVVNIRKHKDRRDASFSYDGTIIIDDNEYNRTLNKPIIHKYEGLADISTTNLEYRLLPSTHNSQQYGLLDGYIVLVDGQIVDEFHTKHHENNGCPHILTNFIQTYGDRIAPSTILIVKQPCSDCLRILAACEVTALVFLQQRFTEPKLINKQVPFHIFHAGHHIEG